MKNEFAVTTDEWFPTIVEQTGSSLTSINAMATLTDPWRSRSTVQNACNLIADYSEKSADQRE